MCIYLPGRVWYLHVVIELSCYCILYILLPRSDLSDFSGDFSVLKSCFLTISWVEGKISAGTNTLAYIGSLLTALPRSEFLNRSQRFD